MSNIRTVNKHHKRALTATIARSRTAANPATEAPTPVAGEPVQAAG